MSRHIVTKASKDGTFQVGDHITFMPDGSIICQEANGWIEPTDAPRAIKGMDSQPDREGLRKRWESLRADLEALENYENYQKS